MRLTVLFWLSVTHSLEESVLARRSDFACDSHHHRDLAAGIDGLEEHGLAAVRDLACLYVVSRAILIILCMLLICLSWWSGSGSRVRGGSRGRHPSQPGRKDAPLALDAPAPTPTPTPAPAPENAILRTRAKAASTVTFGTPTSFALASAAARRGLCSGSWLPGGRRAMWTSCRGEPSDSEARRDEMRRDEMRRERTDNKSKNEDGRYVENREDQRQHNSTTAQQHEGSSSFAHIHRAAEHTTPRRVRCALLVPDLGPARVA
jgi:hypothetical protein